MQNFEDRHLGDALVLGLGVSGKACAQYLSNLLNERVDSLTIYAGDSTPDSVEWIERFKASLPAGVIENMDIIFDDREVCGRFDICIASPGISEFSDFYTSAKAASTEIISEVEFAWRESSAASKWVAITGTNGKTTTTALTAFILEQSGIAAKAVGNIGDACIETVANSIKSGVDNMVYVAECSSYQLASTVDFAPDVAIILGITPDHLAWHETHENYRDAKFKLLDNLRTRVGAVAVLDAVNDEVRSKIKELRTQTAEERGFAYIPLGTKAGITGDMRKACGAQNAAFVNEDGELEIVFADTDHLLADISKMQLKGPHNQVNALAAASAAVLLGVKDKDIAQAQEAFAPLEHRIEPVGIFNGVEFYNDSKATNVDATLVALGAFGSKRPIIMLGGRDKGTPLDDLVRACEEHAGCIICFGEARQRFYEGLCGLSDLGIDVVCVDTFDDAFQTAAEHAVSGDVVLLSPACASFDEFSCFEERGDHFKELFAKLASNGVA